MRVSCCPCSYLEDSVYIKFVYGYWAGKNVDCDKMVWLSTRMSYNFSIWWYAAVVKNPLAVQEAQEIQLRSLCQEDPLEEEMAPTPVSLTGKTHGQRSLVGCSPWGWKERKKERKKESEITQSCLTLCNPEDCSIPGSSVHGILQARILEWVAISMGLQRVRHNWANMTDWAEKAKNYILQTFAARILDVNLVLP